MNELITKAHFAAKNARKNSYAPYSKFFVGAALIDQDDNIWKGCNVENGSYGATVCAERVSVFNAIAQGGIRPFKFILLVTEPVAVPCALCLQVFSEFCPPSFKIILSDNNAIHRELMLKDLLPTPFNSELLNK